MYSVNSHYTIIIQWSDEDDCFVVSFPEWGEFCHTHGETYEEALKNAQEVIEMLIETSLENGELSTEERRRLFKMGDKSLAFVNNSLTAAQSNPDILPASFDLEEFVRDYQLAATLTELLIALRQLSEQVDDTLLAVGSEAMSSSLTVYGYVKTAAKKTPGLKRLAEQLGDRFKAIRNKPVKPASES